MKSFTYLASKLPAREFLEAFDEEAAVEPIAFMMDQMSFLKDVEKDNLTQAKFHPGTIDLNAFIGRPQVNPDVPLTDDEGLFPCMLAMCGSGFGYMQVPVVDYLLVTNNKHQNIILDNFESYLKLRLKSTILK